jgi:bacillithiol system protein YtxJ
MQHKLQEIIRESFSQTIFIFKHSTWCNVSSLVKMRLEENWSREFMTDTEIYLLDVFKHRDLSNEVASLFQVHHESPQILLIQDGECFHDASHFDITVEEIREVI